MSGQTEVIEALIRLLASDDATQRSNARGELVQMGTPAVGQLSAALKHEQSHVRWEAAKALGKIADPNAIPALLDALADDDHDVRWVAGEALIAIGPGTLEPLLQKLLQPGRPEWFYDGAHHVVRELNKSASDDVLKPLLEAFHTTEVEVSIPVAAGKVLDAMRQR